VFDGGETSCDDEQRLAKKKTKTKVKALATRRNTRWWSSRDQSFVCCFDQYEEQ